MKIIYHKKYRDVYAGNPAAKPNRIESIYEKIHGNYELLTPLQATEEDIRLVHTTNHIESIRLRKTIYNHALLAAGGAIKTAQIAINVEPAFGLIRPPGHHASPNKSWGFCYFNNIAIAIEKLRKEDKISNALIVDFDLHYGDGTANIFKAIPEVSYYHLPKGRQTALESLSNHLEQNKENDIIALSAGFDRHLKDWGGTLKTEDYRRIGQIAKNYARENCKGRRFAVLEGGYNLQVLGRNVQAFLRGFE